ncbi:hypothetical protein [Tahibacter soli]|uniref:Uncharacterized protein n=1 Tax=Tahibacter soli TaxID=2983605 RepID=A0A9X3YFP3_9GAMM|nr:hypothetical protein [Tahibacter soli]MDC8011017.1 hypothetical protein [Tahibacter soli]
MTADTAVTVSAWLPVFVNVVAIGSLVVLTAWSRKSTWAGDGTIAASALPTPTATAFPAKDEQRNACRFLPTMD